MLRTLGTRRRLDIRLRRTRVRRVKRRRIEGMVGVRVVEDIARIPCRAREGTRTEDEDAFYMYDDL